MLGRFFAYESRAPLMLGCDEDCDCKSELGCKKCQKGKKRRRYKDMTLPDTSNAPQSQWDLRGERIAPFHWSTTMGQTTPAAPAAPAPGTPRPGGGVHLESVAIGFGAASAIAAGLYFFCLKKKR